MSTPVSDASNSMRAKASQVAFCLVNEYRERKGLPSFQWNDALQQAANEHCVEASLKPPTTKKEPRPSQAIRERIHSTVFALQEFSEITLRVAVPSDADPTTVAEKVEANPLVSEIALWLTDIVSDLCSGESITVAQTHPKERCRAVYGGHHATFLIRNHFLHAVRHSTAEALDQHSATVREGCLPPVQRASRLEGVQSARAQS